MRALLTFVVALSASLALAGISRSAEPAVAAALTGPAVPKPTKPTAPKTEPDELFRTALAEVLKEPREAIVPRQGPVLVRKDGPHVSSRIIPPGTERGIALVTPSQLEALAGMAPTGRFYYLTLRLHSTTEERAVVEVTLLPAVVKGQLPMCCWSVEREYRRTSTGWVFERVVSEGVM